MSSSSERYIDIGVFRDQGFAQEVNRLCLHPLGLSLEVGSELCPGCDGDGQQGKGATAGPCSVCGGTGEVERIGVRDHRTDPAGPLFDAGEIEAAKIKAVGKQRERHRKAREARIGAGRIVQPKREAA